ncbi:MAG: hypothetical protein LBO77_07285 [Desulfovibrio sp.]|nr:hypothetical protein [Desulfovibrio sp.]
MPIKISLTDEEQEFVRTLAEKLPPVIARKQIDRFLGGVVAPQTLCNADHKGEGPEIAYMIGRSVAYFTIPLLEWILKNLGVTKLKRQHGANMLNLMDKISSRRPSPCQYTSILLCSATCLGCENCMQRRVQKYAQYAQSDPANYFFIGLILGYFLGYLKIFSPAKQFYINVL